MLCFVVISLIRFVITVLIVDPWNVVGAISDINVNLKFRVKSVAARLSLVTLRVKETHESGLQVFRIEQIRGYESERELKSRRSQHVTRCQPCVWFVTC